MPLFYDHDFDEGAYASHHPRAEANVASGSLYAHCITSLPPLEAARYRVSTSRKLVTVVVPAYNVASWLEYTLESVRAQTYPDWECLVVDDYSTDETIRVAKRFVAMDRRFRIVPHRANGGQNCARNSGLRCARGRYICFLDGDDLLMRTSIEHRLHAIIANEHTRLAGSYCASLTIGESEREPPRSHDRRDMKLVDFLTAGGLCPFNANQPMFKTAVLRSLGGFDEGLTQAEDWELWQRVLRHGYHLAPTLTVDVTYRSRSGSMVRSAPLAHLAAARAIYGSAHSPFPGDDVYRGTPYVFRKPWIEYKKQLDLSNRVFEFCGMALAAGEPVANVAEAVRESLPDFFGAVLPHRDFAAGLRQGMDRQLAGVAAAGESDHRARVAAGECIEYLARLDAQQRVDRPETTPATSGPRWEREIDVVFLPHKDYQVWSFSLLLEQLRRRDISYVFVDMTAVYRDEGARRKLDELQLPYVSYNRFLLGDFRPKMVVCMNDWDPIVRRVIESCKALSIPTVGIVEGIQDYLDADTGKSRRAYRTVDHVILPGEFDRRYFRDSTPKVRVGGVPRIDELLRHEAAFPARPLVVINSNFTYNVLTEHRDEWLRLAVGACKELGLDYVISRHPADTGDFSGYEVGTESMYDLIKRGSVFVSRFGSGILEALALGKPAVYFNPHGEKVDKFKEPDGAFPISETYADLLIHLRATIADPQQFLRWAPDYLELHCGTRRDSPTRASDRVAAELVAIYRSADIPTEEQRDVLKFLMLHREGQLLGKLPAPPSTARSVGLPAASAARSLWHRAWSLAEDLGQKRSESLGRKLKKLRRDPRAFAADSNVRVLQIVSRFM